MLQSATIEIVDFLVSTIMFAFVLSRIDNYKLLCLVFEVQTLCRDFFYDRYSSLLVDVLLSAKTTSWSPSLKKRCPFPFVLWG